MVAGKFYIHFFLFGWLGLGAFVPTVLASTSVVCKPALRGLRDIELIRKMVDARIEFLKDRPYTTVRELKSQKFESGEDIIYVLGMPAHVREVVPGEKVFRRYLSKSQWERAVVNRSIQNGPVPYIRRSAQVSQTIYSDLTGIFVTLPENRPQDVGVSSDSIHYIDFVIPEGVRLLEVEKGKIYLIPLQKLYPKWLRRPYQEYVRGISSGMDRYTEQLVQEVVNEGGLLSPVSLKIKILNHSGHSQH